MCASVCLNGLGETYKIKWLQNILFFLKWKNTKVCWWYLNHAHGANWLNVISAKHNSVLDNILLTEWWETKTILLDSLLNTVPKNLKSSNYIFCVSSDYLINCVWLYDMSSMLVWPVSQSDRHMNISLLQRIKMVQIPLPTDTLPTKGRGQRVWSFSWLDTTATADIWMN